MFYRSNVAILRMSRNYSSGRQCRSWVQGNAMNEICANYLGSFKENKYVSSLVIITRDCGMKTTGLANAVFRPRISMLRKRRISLIFEIRRHPSLPPLTAGSNRGCQASSRRRVASYASCRACSFLGTPRRSPS